MIGMQRLSLDCHGFPGYPSATGIENSQSLRIHAEPQKTARCAGQQMEMLEKGEINRQNVELEVPCSRSLLLHEAPLPFACFCHHPHPAVACGC